MSDGRSTLTEAIGYAGMPAPVWRGYLLGSGALFLLYMVASETDAPLASHTNDSLRASLELQEQLHASQLALRQNRGVAPVMRWLAHAT